MAAARADRGAPTATNRAGAVAQWAAKYVALTAIVAERSLRVANFTFCLTDLSSSTRPYHEHATDQHADAMCAAPRALRFLVEKIFVRLANPRRERTP